VADFASVVRRLMTERGMSLRGLARVIHYDPSYLSKILSGRKPVTLRLAALADDALNAGGEIKQAAMLMRAGAASRGQSVSGQLPRDAVTSAAAGTRSEPSPAIAELCALLTDYGFDPGRFSSAPSGEVRSPVDLERDVRVTFDVYQQGRFTSAASRASMLLADAQLAVRDCERANWPRVQRVLALSYQAAASVLTKAGEADLALIAAERGLNAAEEVGDPPVRASLIRCVAFTLHSTGRFELAMRLIESGADYLNNQIRGDDATLLSVYGTLFLVGSMAAARFGDGSRTSDYLGEAARAARRLGRDANHLWTAFGPTNVAIHRVNTAVELGDLRNALDSGLSLNTGAVPVERRVRYLLDVARVYSMTGDRDNALNTMLTAERIAPDQVRQHYVSREVVMNLARSSIGKPAVELAHLAGRIKSIRIGELA
jgi:transcriptional regulator with XRE-family HTH domain